MSLGTEPPADRNIRKSNSGSAAIQTRNLPDVMLGNQARGLSYEDMEGQTERLLDEQGQTESLSDEDAGRQAQGLTDENAKGQAHGSMDEDRESTTQSSLGYSLRGPDGRDLDEDHKGLCDPGSSDEGLNKVRDENLELDYEAFRTITSLLAALTQTRPDLRRSDEGGPMPVSTSAERRVLKICNSLAVLAVIQHEDIAIGVDYQPSSVNVIISTSLAGPTKLDALVNKNPRHEEYLPLNKPTEAQLTTIPQVPTGLKEYASRALALKEFDEEAITPDVLSRYITSLNVTRDNPTLEEHIWMLLRIFNTWKKPDDINPRLMPYVTMTCFPKMFGQINHPRWRFYLKVFRDVKTSSISFSEARGRKETPVETQCDVRFLDLFMKTHRKWPEDKYPCLHKLGRQNGQSFQLYNKDTCREFHSVVKSIIKSFQDSISMLNSYREKLRGKDNNTPILDSITDLCTKVNRYGRMLRRLCAGAALRMHLENINESLACILQPARKRKQLFKSASGGAPLAAVSNVNVDAEGSEVDEGNFEADEEPETLATEHQVPWQIWLRWLKLLIAQFDAAGTLVGYIAFPDFPVISATILQNTPGSHSLMEWKQLLNNTKYFPEQSVVAGRDRDNAGIIKSFEQAISGRPYELGSHLEDIRSQWKCVIEAPQTRDQKEETARKINDQFCQMEESLSLVPGCQATLGDIRRDIAKWLENSSAPISNSLFPLSTIVANQISDQIESMLDMCYVCSRFDNPSPFGSTVHCEAILASYLALHSLPDADDEKLEHVQDFRRIIAVSKEHCCPVCEKLLRVLTAGTCNFPFLSKSSHNIVSACSLPAGLPRRVIDLMNREFGEQLRIDIVQLLNKAEMIRSAGSDTVSAGSREMPNGASADKPNCDTLIDDESEEDE